jgi:5'-nucleotidase
MNEAGLEVSAAGNHEFDRGYRDLVERVMDPTDPEGGADWEYLAANVRLDDDHGAESGNHALASAARGNSNGATWWRELPGGRTIGFVGAMTEDLPSLVSPDSLAEVVITDLVTEVNASAAELSEPNGCGTEACDLVVLLVHEGAASPALAAATDPGTAFGHIVTETSPNVDAIVSGHTHLSYNHKVEVPAWVAEGRAVTKRPVVSAGQYGYYLNQLEFEFEQGSDNLVNLRQHVLAMKDHEADPATQAIVDDAVDFAAVAGSAALGGVEGQFLRAQRNDPATGTTVENRGGESTLGNLVAEIQRWRTGADLGVMNPGGLRADLNGNDDGTVTYREAADVQPFANTLMTVEMTGAQIKSLLEQQWQRDSEGNIPSRPFLRLGTSKGFSFTEDATRAEGDRITGMWLDGEPIDAAAAYTVSATNFLVSGGDNFRALTEGTAKTDTGFTDLQATVDYLAANAPVGGAPLPVDLGQHGVGASVPTVPFAPGDTVTIALSSLSMTGPGDAAESSVTVAYGGVDLDTETVVTTLPTQPFDTSGTATVSFPMPSGIAAGTAWFELTGVSGTVAHLPVRAADGRTDTEITAPDVSAAYNQAGSVVAAVTPTGATGSVTFMEGATTLGTVDLTTEGGATTATYDFVANSLSVGVHTLRLSYGGSGTHKPSETTVEVTITRAATTVTGPPATIHWSKGGTVGVRVTPTAATGTVELYSGGTRLGVATLSGGAASIRVGSKALPVGTHTLVVRYLGNATHASSQGTVTVTVTNGKQKP